MKNLVHVKRNTCDVNIVQHTLKVHLRLRACVYSLLCFVNCARCLLTLLRLVAMQKMVIKSSANRPSKEETYFQHRNNRSNGIKRVRGKKMLRSAKKQVGKKRIRVTRRGNEDIIDNSRWSYANYAQY